MNRSASDNPVPEAPVIAVVGPTAVGKTALAEELAVRFGGEIVSADSMQVYRGMDIGTAKPAPAERRVPYHCVDLVAPGTPYSAALYQADSRAAIADCLARSVLPIMCGGTGLYVRAALDDLAFPSGEQIANPVRAGYEQYAAVHGNEALHALLAERDPDSAALLHPNNVRRVVRALEMSDEGISYARHSAGLSQRRSIYNARFLGVTMDRGLLYERIDARVEAMVADGLVNEVAHLLDEGFRDALTAAQAIGYKEFVPVVEEGESLEKAIEAVKQSSRRYAKRQLTWFRGDPRVQWLDVTDLSLAEQADAASQTLHLTESLWTAR